MRLLHTKSLRVEEFGAQAPPYGILSHTWGIEEVALQAIETEAAKNLIGYGKVARACFVAAADGFEYIWIDTCCIDKTSSAELSEALNSMHRWYQEAGQCYAYLADVPRETAPRPTGTASLEFRQSKWFTRGWTLQELIAPATVIFFNSEWHDIGTKSSLYQVISEITGIPGSFLLGDDLGHASVAQRMSWASKRETRRVEDLAYCLMGLFGIYMPMLYGEGERAFIRLQEEIMRVSDDHSLFAWRSAEDHGGILATSPAAFADSGNIIPINPSYSTSSPSTVNSRGINLSLPFMFNDDQTRTGLAILHCTEIGKESMRLAIHMRDLIVPKDEFARERSSTVEMLSVEKIDPSQYPVTSICVRQWRQKRNRALGDIQKCVIKLEGIEGKEVGIRAIDLDSDWEFHNGLIVTTKETIADGVLGRLLIVCQDGNWFQVFLSKSGRFLSAHISTSSQTDSPIYQRSKIPETEHQDKDRIVKALGDGTYVHVAIKKRILLLQEKNYLTNVVEISYSSNLRRMWLEHVAVLESDKDEKSLLIYAAKRGLTDVAKQLLKKYKEDTKDRYGRTLLSLAAEGGYLSMIKLLLLNPGSTVNRKDDHGMTALMWAAAGGHDAVVEMLLVAGAVKFHWKDSEYGRTPLAWAAANGHDAVVTLLLAARRISVGSKEKKGKLPLYSTLIRQKTLFQLPFEKETPLDSKDNAGRTPIESKDNSGRTPLLLAAMNGHKGVVDLLLDKGAKLESADNDGLTPLSIAVMNNHTAVMQLLLERGASYDSVDVHRRTPLLLAAMKGHEAIVQLLLEKVSGVDSKDKNEWTSLAVASNNGHLAIVKLLIEAEAELDAKDSDNMTPLSLAARNGHTEVVQVLLDSGAGLNYMDKFGRGPLSLAAMEGYEAVVSLLLETDIDIEAKDSYGMAPLSLAAAKGHTAVVQLLLEHVAWLESTNVNSRTPLLLAAMEGHKDIVWLLLKSGAKLETKDNQGSNALSHAIMNGHTDVCRLLLQRGAGLEYIDGHMNPLLLAAIEGNKDIVALLLERGAGLEVKDAGGMTALALACRYGHAAVVELLLKSGAQPKSRNKHGRTPLWWAKENADDKIINLLSPLT